MSIFMKIRPLEAELSHADRKKLRDGWTGRYDEASNRLLWGHFVKEPKNRGFIAFVS